MVPMRLYICRSYFVMKRHIFLLSSEYIFLQYIKLQNKLTSFQVSSAVPVAACVADPAAVAGVVSPCEAAATARTTKNAAKLAAIQGSIAGMLIF